jgi:hypothetical protein
MLLFAMLVVCFAGGPAIGVVCGAPGRAAAGGRQQQEQGIPAHVSTPAPVGDALLTQNVWTPCLQTAP